MTEDRWRTAHNSVVRYVNDKEWLLNQFDELWEARCCLLLVRLANSLLSNECLLPVLVDCLTVQRWGLFSLQLTSLKSIDLQYHAILTILIVDEALHETYLMTNDDGHFRLPFLDEISVWLGKNSQRKAAVRRNNLTSDFDSFFSCHFVMSRLYADFSRIFSVFASSIIHDSVYFFLFFSSACLLAILRWGSWDSHEGSRQAKKCISRRSPSLTRHDTVLLWRVTHSVSLLCYQVKKEKRWHVRKESVESRCYWWRIRSRTFVFLPLWWCDVFSLLCLSWKGKELLSFQTVSSVTWDSSRVRISLVVNADWKGCSVCICLGRILWCRKRKLEKMEKGVGRRTTNVVDAAAGVFREKGNLQGVDYLSWDSLPPFRYNLVDHGLRSLQNVVVASAEYLPR